MIGINSLNIRNLKKGQGIGINSLNIQNLKKGQGEREKFQMCQVENKGAFFGGGA